MNIIDLQVKDTVTFNWLGEVVTGTVVYIRRVVKDCRVFFRHSSMGVFIEEIPFSEITSIQKYKNSNLNANTFTTAMDSFDKISDEKIMKMFEEMHKQPLQFVPSDHFWTDELIIEFIKYKFDREKPITYLAEIMQFKKDKLKPKEYNILAYFSEVGINDGKIHTVKRLSDGKIFTVGSVTKQGMIESFYINCNNLFAQVVDGVELININDLLNLTQVLFTTYDGIEITNPLQIVYTVNKERWNTSERLAKNATETHRLIFSTTEARDKYVLKHKPLLTTGEIYAITAKYGRDAVNIEKEIEILAKTKLETHKI